MKKLRKRPVLVDELFCEWEFSVPTKEIVERRPEFNKKLKISEFSYGTCKEI